MKTWMIVVITAVAVLLLEFVWKKFIIPAIMYVVNIIDQKKEDKEELEKRVKYIEKKLDINSWDYKELKPYVDDNGGYIETTKKKNKHSKKYYEE